MVQKAKVFDHNANHYVMQLCFPAAFLHSTARQSSALFQSLDVSLGKLKTRCDEDRSREPAARPPRHGLHHQSPDCCATRANQAG